MVFEFEYGESQPARTCTPLCMLVLAPTSLQAFR